MQKPVAEPVAGMVAPMRAFSYHLTAGSDLLDCLQQLAQHHGTPGFVLGVVGNLSQAAFQCPGQPHPTVVHGELEIITLQGTLTAEGVHLHLSCSDAACQVWGGHLEPGTLVLKGVDVLIGCLTPEGQTAPTAPVALTPMAQQPVRVLVAASDQCPFSRRAMRLLQILGIPFERVEPMAGHGVPQVSIDGQFIGGYEALVHHHAAGLLDDLRQA